MLLCAFNFLQSPALYVPLLLKVVAVLVVVLLSFSQ